MIHDYRRPPLDTEPRHYRAGPPQAQAAPVSAAAGQQKGAPPPPAWPFPVGVLATEVQNDYDQTVTATTATVSFPDVKVDPDGWLRGLWFDFKMVGTNTTSTTVTANADWPQNAVNTVLFKDTGTQQAFGPLGGFDWQCINKFGSYQVCGDPRADQVYSTTTGTATTAGSANWMFYLPLEISAHDALGDVQNQSDNSIYKIAVTLESTATMFTTAPSTSTTCEMKVVQDSYSEPVAALALGGRPVRDAPPVPGTRQFWVKDDDSALPSSGSHTTKITNGIGYAFRTVILEYYDNATVPTREGGEDAWPDPMEFWLAGTRIKKLEANYWLNKMGRDFNLTTTTHDAARGIEDGVRALYWTKDVSMVPGNEARRRYLRTQDGQVFKIVATYSQAGTLYMLSNYVIPKGGPSAFSQIVA